MFGCCLSSTNGEARILWIIRHIPKKTLEYLMEIYIYIYTYIINLEYSFVTFLLPTIP